MDINRYRRQIIIDDIGLEGQKKLLKSRILLIGAGGLGSPIAYYLTAAGIGKIGIVDDDKVDISNLQRQILHNTKDLGKEKVISAKEKLNELNTDTEIEIYCMRLDKENFEEIIGNYDLIINATDNLETRYIINETCVENKKILIEGSINGFHGQVMAIKPYDSPCYNCLYPSSGEKEKKQEIGAIGFVTGIIGSIEAAEAIKILLGIGETLIGKLLIINTLNMSFNTLKIKKNTNCLVCGD